MRKLLHMYTLCLASAYGRTRTTNYTHTTIHHRTANRTAAGATIPSTVRRLCGILGRPMIPPALVAR